MSKEADTVMQGRLHAETGGFPGDNPWPSWWPGPEHKWWLRGFLTRYPANDTEAPPAPPSPVGLPFARIA